MKLQTTHLILLIIIGISFQSCQKQVTPLTGSKYVRHISSVPDVTLVHTDSGQTVVTAIKEVPNPLMEVRNEVLEDYESVEDLEFETFFLETATVNESFETKDEAELVAASMSFLRDDELIPLAGPVFLDEDESTFRFELRNEQQELLDIISENDELQLRVEVTFNGIVNPTFISKNAQFRVRYTGNIPR